jgi:hypothetical protein
VMAVGVDGDRWSIASAGLICERRGWWSARSSHGRRWC